MFAGIDVTSDKQIERCFVFAGIDVTSEKQIEGCFMFAGIDVTSDKQIDEFVSAYGDSSYHPSCTCKMGDAANALCLLWRNYCSVPSAFSCIAMCEYIFAILSLLLMS